MTVQATVTMTNGRVVQGVNYRLASYANPNQPSVPASPYPFHGGVYHLQTALGWVDVAACEVRHVDACAVCIQ